MDKCINEFFLFGDEIKTSKEFENFNNNIGESLYEVIRVSDGIPIFFMEHIERLENSAKIMEHSLSIKKDEIINRIIKLISKNNVLSGNIKLVINYSISVDSKKNSSLSENFLAYFIPHNYPSKQQYVEGVKTITYHGERSNPNAKVINNTFREKVNIQIKNNSAYEAILVDNKGYITEGSKSNIFLVKGSTVVTSNVINVLPGITRQFIIKTCKKLNIKFEEKDIQEKDLKSYTGLFISGTSPNVLPIKSVDGFSFNSSNNSIIKLIIEGFAAELNENKNKFVKYIKNSTINN